MVLSRRAARAVLAAACLPLVACTAGPPTGGSTDLPGDIDITAYADVHATLDSSRSSIVYPIDAYFISRADLGRIAQANALLWDDCMRATGRTYPPAAFDLASDYAPADTFYGIWNEDDAARFGYDPAPTVDGGSDVADDALAAADEADPAWGPALDACLDSTDRLPELGRDFAGEDGLEISELPQSIRNDAGVLASATPEWEQARARWSECLEAHGLQLATDRQSPWTPEIPNDPEAEIRTAVTDVQCKKETALVETLSSLEAQYQAALIDRHRAALDEVAEKERAVVQRADEIIATHGG